MKSEWIGSDNELFPEPVLNIIKALNDAKRRRILLILKNKNEITWKDLLAETKLDKGDMNYHIRILLKSGLISNYVRDGGIEQSKSFYSVTKLFDIMMVNLIGPFSSEFRALSITNQPFYDLNGSASIKGKIEKLMPELNSKLAGTTQISTRKIPPLAEW
jgi:DNA-binding transcriptional ArsR family regulator